MFVFTTLRCCVYDVCTRVTHSSRATHKKSGARLRVRVRLYRIYMRIHTYIHVCTTQPKSQRPPASQPDDDDDGNGDNDFATSRPVCIYS